MTDPQRYRVTLSNSGTPIAQGWWGDHGSADRKFRSWIGDYGGRPGTHIELAERDGYDWIVLKSWP
ncbi:hypothetical protein [Streptomyces aureoverticillatus]|uniref:hypothetical protein n=1 Tax=Streptomyces aureoverticillatus TaxID=66871 RepID=UPI0013D96810|nr:hypothetical protein [Streptomyces aureoverticillatus]QIB49562.1 hypothetical protein G3H79_41090 [Streptomyces aureoverticillatus]